MNNFEQMSLPLQKTNPNPSNEDYKKFLEARLAKLKFLCDNLDPYAPIPSPLKKELRNLGFEELNQEIYDPFTLTNKLILLVENTIEELESYKNV